MDSDESEEIISENTYNKKNRKRRERKKRKNRLNNDNDYLNSTLKLLSFIVFIFLIIYIFQFILLFKKQNSIIKDKEKQKNKHHLKKENNNEIKNESNTHNKNGSEIKENNKIINNKKSLSVDEKVEILVKSLPKVQERDIAEFRKINSERILYDSTQHKKKESPDVSVILITNNQAHCIHKAIRSIQNQSLKNIEIIISIDCSLDNSTETIQSFMEEDKRIILINHSTKEGTMKNRIDGIRIARGKYITVVDGDDALIQKDILKNALSIASMGNIDIVEFYGNMYSKEELKGTIHKHKINGIIRQPELRTRFFAVDENFDAWRPIVCRTIWGKLIKNEVLQKSIKLMGPKYSDDFILVYEDTMMIVALYQTAQSYYLYKEVGYYYSRDEFWGRYPKVPNRICYKRNNANRGDDCLKFLNFLYEKMEDNEKERKTICHEIISINAYDFSKFAKRLNSDYDMFYYVVDGLLDSKYLNEKEKIKLREIKSEVVNKEKGINH